MELNNDHHSDMEMTHSASGTSRSSTPSMNNCDRLQIANAELRKFSILYSNVTYAIESAAPYAQDDDQDMADLYTRQAYMDQRRLQAVSDFNTLPRCNTPGCQIHFTPLNSPSKCVIDDFPELPKRVSSKRKESEDGFISPTSKQTFKMQKIDLKNFELETNNRFTKLNDKDIAGHSQNAGNISQHSPTLVNLDSTTTPSTLPPPMATHSNTRRSPAISHQKQANQIVLPSPIVNNSNVEDNSPQALILQTLQQTIQALTVITQQFSALSFNNPAPQPKKPKTKLTKPQL
ncbi:hypothetical protein TNIN_470791 [Trichonephila inaurata madagascariensis]|uniref:Uncharacterized protein n=1 Tax=Trichonephila inaurata madagascariensis TaxID=2747483 RepID=A0A8X7C3L7_9ARAC|nr:hypothetical protein TNIN_470791 [Trichonephila inaurata madagascariensis]